MGHKTKLKPIEATIVPSVTRSQLFCYGTLNVKIVQQGVWGEAKHGTPFTLNDYEMKMYTNNIFFIERKLGEQVSGKLYTLTDDELTRTDTYEGEAYRRTAIIQDTKVVETYIRIEQE